METINFDTTMDYKVAEVQLSYHPNIKASERPKIVSATDAYNIFMQVWDKNKLQFLEQCKVLLIDRANRALGVVEISSGGLTCTIVDPKLVFIAALKAAASAIILCHNHPSNNPRASEEDKHLTERIKRGCKLLEIQFFDHLIITAEGFTSLSNEGLL